jgi:hypothetical protein
MPLGRGAALGRFAELRRCGGYQRERIEVIARACCKVA